MGLYLCVRIVVGVVIFIELFIMLIGFVFVVEKCLKIVGFCKEDIDFWEINEVFVFVVFRYMCELGISEEVINVNGGVIVMGYLLGVIGGMFVSMVLDELECCELKCVMILFCVGGGMGIFIIIERL